MKKRFSTTYLPNGTEVFCIKKGEVRSLYKELQGYMKHNISLKEGDIIFDVGANIGLFSLMANDLCAVKADIYAFEPVPEVFKVLKSNAIKFNSSKIKAFQIGLGNRSEVVDFSYYPNLTLFSTLYPDSSGAEKRRIATTLKKNTRKLDPPFNLIGFLPEPLLSFVADRLIDLAYVEQKMKCQIKTISDIITEQSIKRIDLLKIDVEKAEMDVLEGIKEHDWSKVQQITMEVHNLIKGNPSSGVEQVASLVKSKGFMQVHQEHDSFGNLHLYAKR